MKLFLYCLPRPDFMQTMQLMTAVLLLTLEKRKGWKKRLILCLVVADVIGGVIGFLFFEFGKSSIMMIRLPVEILYYTIPLIGGYVTLRFCSAVSAYDVLYGTSCAYAMQHAAFCLTIVLWGEHQQEAWHAIHIIREWGINLLLALIFYFLIAKVLPQQGRYGTDRRKAVSSALIVLFIALVLNYIVRMSLWTSDAVVYKICMGYDFCFCLLLLYFQTEWRREKNLETELEHERQLRRKMRDQYEFSKKNIEQINRKCHDLKHQVAALRMMTDKTDRETGLQELESAVMIYDSTVKTGNEVLDTVLTEKSLICEQTGISWTCMADGKQLDFLSTTDLYILFGNALDNAIESCRKMENEEQRIVAVTVMKRHGAVFIQTENYYRDAICMRDGIPVTTKEDKENHGFGLRSIKNIVERYDGTMHISTENGIFLLSILIPIPMAA